MCGRLFPARGALAGAALPITKSVTLGGEGEAIRYDLRVYGPITRSERDAAARGGASGSGPEMSTVDLRALT